MLINHEFVLHNFLHVELPRKQINHSVLLPIKNEGRVFKWCCITCLMNYLLFRNFKWFHIVTNNFEFFFKFKSFPKKNFTLVRKTSFERNSWCKCFKSCSYWASLLEGKTKRKPCRKTLSIMHTLRIFVHDLQFFPIHLPVLLIYVLPKIENQTVHIKSHAKTKDRLVQKKRIHHAKKKEETRECIILRFGGFSSIFSAFQINFHYSNTASDLYSNLKYLIFSILVCFLYTLN